MRFPTTLLRWPTFVAALPVSLLMFASAASVHAQAGRDWSDYLGDANRSHFSTLSQITPENVSRLEVAWTYTSGDFTDDMRTQIQCNPLVIDGVVYATTALQVVVAIDGDTGKEIWRFDPRKDGKSNTSDVRHRGMTYWDRGGKPTLILAHDHFLYAISADTGKLVESFAERGILDFKAGWSDERGGFLLNSGTPGVIFENLYIMPIRTTESHEGSAPGHVRAFNLDTGKEAWTFYTIPRPGEHGHDTWPAEAHKSVGGANCWGGMTIDAERGLLYVPTGSATYDFWGGYRLGNNLFANCLICLDVRTGKRVWHFQFVHHDLWDRDLPAPPNLFTMRRDGTEIAAVAQVTKSGHIFVFNRETGEPLFDIEERPVPSSDIPGEVTAATQPFPVKPAPISRQGVTYEELTTRTPEAHRAVVERYSRLRPSVPFMPPSREGSIVAPGLDGGAEWGGAAVDPRGIMYVNGSETPWILSMVESSAGSRATPHERGRGQYMQLCTACHGVEMKGNQLQNIPGLIDIASRLKRPEVIDRITNGKGAMPAFGFLPEETIKAIADYVMNPKLGSAAMAAASAGTVNDAGHRGPVTTKSSVPWVVPRHERFVDPDGYPAVKTPWGTLNAVDLNTGDYLWKVPLGEYPELTAKGVPITGADTYGGAVITKGGVLFIAGTSDKKIRAFNMQNGEQLWEASLPTGGYATPATYELNGRQFVVIACGGGKLGSPSGDTYMAFALPQSAGAAKSGK